MKGSILIVIIIVFIVLLSSIYTVDEAESVVITRFGKPVGKTVMTPGLKFKLPLIDHKNSFSKKILEWDGKPNQVPTSDKKYISIDTTARWRIADPLLYLRSVRDERRAQGRLDSVINSATREVVRSNLLIELVRNSNRKMTTIKGIELSDEVAEIKKGRDKLAKNIFDISKESVKNYGIELIDVKIKRLNYGHTGSVQKKVFMRMISERKRIAEKYRSEGQGEKAEILGNTKKDLDRIFSSAYKEAELIKGNADAKATTIYAEAFNQDPEFYSFLKSLETYERIFDKNTEIIFSTDNEFMKYFNNSSIDKK